MLRISGYLTNSKIGKTKTCTFRVSKTGIGNGGNNFAYQVGGTWTRDGLYMFGASLQYRALSEDRKRYWETIRCREGFRSKQTAFISSFLSTVAYYGYVYAMTNLILFRTSYFRKQRYIQYNESEKRFQKNGMYKSQNALSETRIESHHMDIVSPEVIPVIQRRNDLNQSVNIEIGYRKTGFGEGNYGKNTFGKYIYTMKNYMGYSTWSFGTMGYGN